MNTIKLLFTLCVIAISAAACTASVRVMPGANDMNRVVARDIEKHGAEKAAFKAAIAYCEDYGKEAVFISDDVRYEGVMDEAERAAIRKQSEAAIVLGGVARSSGDHETADMLEGAGVSGSTMTSGKDYTAEVEFKCRLS